MLVISISDLSAIAYHNARWTIMRSKFKGKTLRAPETLTVDEAKVVDRRIDAAVWLDNSGQILITNKTKKTVTSASRKAEIYEVLKRVKHLEVKGNRSNHYVTD